VSTTCWELLARLSWWRAPRKACRQGFVNAADTSVLAGKRRMVRTTCLCLPARTVRWRRPCFACRQGSVDGRERWEACPQGGSGSARPGFVCWQGGGRSTRPWGGLLASVWRLRWTVRRLPASALEVARVVWRSPARSSGSCTRRTADPQRSALSQHRSDEAGSVRVKSPGRQGRQTTRNRMNAPQVYAIRLRKPVERCSLLGVLRRVGGFDLSCRTLDDEHDLDCRAHHCCFPSHNMHTTVRRAGSARACTQRFCVLSP
jgi:hypothetical protein